MVFIIDIICSVKCYRVFLVRAPGKNNRLSKIDIENYRLRGYFQKRADGSSISKGLI